MPSEQAQLLRLEFKAYYRVSAEIGDKLFLFLLRLQNQSLLRFKKYKNY